mgnify:CR=1 FL=1
MSELLNSTICLDLAGKGLGRVEMGIAAQLLQGRSVEEVCMFHFNGPRKPWKPDHIVERAIDEAVVAIGATLVQSHVHRYSPQGVTGLAVLAESHLSLHSWPEYGYMAADVFTCGTLTIPRRAVAVFKEIFAPGRIEVREIERGVQVGDVSLLRATGNLAAHPTV